MQKITVKTQVNVPFRWIVKMLLRSMSNVQQITITDRNEGIETEIVYFHYKPLAELKRGDYHKINSKYAVKHALKTDDESRNYLVIQTAIWDVFNYADGYLTEAEIFTGLLEIIEQPGNDDKKAPLLEYDIYHPVGGEMNLECKPELHEYKKVTTIKGYNPSDVFKKAQNDHSEFYEELGIRSTCVGDLIVLAYGKADPFMITGTGFTQVSRDWLSFIDWGKRSVIPMV